MSSGEGFLRAKLQGAVEREIDWSDPAAQCRGSLRPTGNGFRLLYRGHVSTDTPAVLLFGIGPVTRGAAARNVAVNFTLIEEGTGRFYATQGDDKCALDELTQVSVAPGSNLYRVTGRGYCTQPARALGGAEGSVLLTRFDLAAVVDYTP